ncbi:MAG TPA: hypothetical protein VMZ28_06640, partial [Kofleriaceae bacterium]|nr:hypothetical protein [Kofleriaceae bacterium]
MKLARTRSLLASAVLAAAAVGFLEATAMALIGDPAGGFTRALAAWSVSFSLAALGALPIAALLLAALGLLAWLRLGREVWGDLAAGGPARARVVWRALLVTAATGVFAVVTFKLASATYAAYADREPALFGAFIAAGVTFLALLVALAAVAIDGQVGDRISASRLASRAVTGRPMRAAVVAIALATVGVPYVLVRIGRPDLQPLVALAGCALLLVVFAVRANAVGRRPRFQLVALGLFLVMAAGL